MSEEPKLAFLVDAVADYLEEEEEHTPISGMCELAALVMEALIEDVDASTPEDKEALEKAAAYFRKYTTTTEYGSLSVG